MTITWPSIFCWTSDCSVMTGIRRYTRNATGSAMRAASSAISGLMLSMIANIATSITAEVNAGMQMPTKNSSTHLLSTATRRTRSPVCARAWNRGDSRCSARNSVPPSSYCMRRPMRAASDARAISVTRSRMNRPAEASASHKSTRDASSPARSPDRNCQSWSTGLPASTPSTISLTGQGSSRLSPIDTSDSVTIHARGARWRAGYRRASCHHALIGRGSPSFARRAPRAIRARGSGRRGPEGSDPPNEWC